MMFKDEIEKLYISDKLDDIYKIYECFSLEEIIDWMRNRPKAKMDIFEVEGGKEAVVIIPTADFNGQLAKHAREVFKGLHMIFVQSNGPLFNYAKSVNEGIRYAKNKYKPKWLIVSNDDVIWAEPPNKLIDALSTVSDNVDLVMVCPPGKAHTKKITLISPKSHVFSIMRLYAMVSKTQWVKVYSKFLKYRKKFGIKFWPAMNTILMNLKFGIEEKYNFLYCGSFCILKDQLFDENFINGVEDIVLSIASTIQLINYKIEFLSGATLGDNELRMARNLINFIYLNWLIEYGKIKLKPSSITRLPINSDC